MSQVTECINCRWNADSGLTHDEYVEANRMMAWLCDDNAARAHLLPAAPRPPRPRNADPVLDADGNVTGYTARP